MAVIRHLLVFELTCSIAKFIDESRLIRSNWLFGWLSVTIDIVLRQPNMMLFLWLKLRQGLPPQKFQFGAYKMNSKTYTPMHASTDFIGASGFDALLQIAHFLNSLFDPLCGRRVNSIADTRHRTYIRALPLHWIYWQVIRLRGCGPQTC